MKTRIQFIASLFTVAMAATLFGAFVTVQLREPVAAQPKEPVASRSASPSGNAPVGLDTFRDIAREANPAVVNINTRAVVKRPRFFNPFGDMFGQDDSQGSRTDKQTKQSLGSGFIIDKAGYILTNRHVIDGAEEIQVTLASGRTLDAKLVGKDARTDVALVKVESKEPLPIIEMGDSDEVEPGEWVMAIGNPFGLGGNSVTVGVMSYRREMRLGAPGAFVETIQTDAAINPGNSGGPLINTRGQVIGINTMIVTGGEAQSAGVGFSVTINIARDILAQLRETGKVVRGWLGVEILSFNEDLAKTYGLQPDTGTVVTQVQPGSPAEKAGLEPEDVILSVDGRKIATSSDLSRYVSGKAPGTVVSLSVHRGDSPIEISVTLGTFPDETADLAKADSSRTQLGMTLRDLTPSLAERMDLPRGTKGALVTEVEPGSAAERAGLRRYDVIVSVSGRLVSGVEELEQAVEAVRETGAARLRILNAQGFRVIALKLR